MPEVIPGYTTEQKVSVVATTQTDINTEITAQAVDGWLVSSISELVSVPDTLILFTRTIAAS